MLGAEQTIHSLAVDIIEHYENYRENLLTGKAMIVAYSREIAMQIYQEILKLRPTWNEKVRVVITETNKDPEDWRPIIGNKKYKEELARKFKDNSDPMKIAIVDVYKRQVLDRSNKCIMERKQGKCPVETRIFPVPFHKYFLSIKHLMESFP